MHRDTNLKIDLCEDRNKDLQVDLSMYLQENMSMDLQLN